MRNEIALLHLYGQGHWHDDAYIVGNTRGLTALRDAITKALADNDNGPDEAEVSVADGEGYGVVIIRDDTSWLGAFWSQLALPYTMDGWATECSPEAIWPWEIVQRSATPLKQP